MRKVTVKLNKVEASEEYINLYRSIDKLIDPLSSGTLDKLEAYLMKTFGSEVVEFIQSDKVSELKKLRLKPKVASFIENADINLNLIQKKIKELVSKREKILALIPKRSDSKDLKELQEEMKVLQKLEKDPKTSKALKAEGEYLMPRIRGLQGRIDAAINTKNAKIDKNDPIYYLYSVSVDTGGDEPRKMWWVTTKPLTNKDTNAWRKRIDDIFERQGMNANNANFFLQKIGPKGAFMGLKSETYTKIEKEGSLMNYSLWDNKHLHWDHLKTPTDAERKAFK